MGRTFSDNWYRVANLRLGMRPTVSVRLQYYRREAWYVLHERVHNTFHRVTPATWRFISRVTVEATVDEIWRSAIEDAPAETPGQEDVFQLIASLYRSNLLYIEGRADEENLLQRGLEKKRKPFLAKLSELMFLRIPLVDPEPWLRRAEPWFRLLFGRMGLLLALLLLGWGTVELGLAGKRAWDQAERLLQWHNVILLYLAVFVAKGLHELGHAALCKYYGAEVRTMGVMLLMFTPLPYVDVSASWTLRNRYQRAMIGAGGMIADLLVAAVATIVWAHSPPGAVNELAYNLMFTTAVYTVIFNLNPLMRFDGYYILADLMGYPNLHEQAKAAFERWFKRRVLAVTGSDDETLTPRAQLWMIAFYLASNVYRLFVMGGIVLFVADAYFGVGLLVAISLALTSFVLPLQKHLRTLRSPLFRFQQKRLLQRGGLVLAGLVLFVLFVPVPDNRVLPGVADAAQRTRVYTESGGQVAAVHVASGVWVEPGTLLVELVNQELLAELAGVEAQISHAELLASKSVEEGAVDLLPMEQRLHTLAQLKATLVRQIQAMQVKASQAGYWVAPEIAYRQGDWLARGAEMGALVDDRTHIFQGVVRQEAASVLAAARQDALEVRLEGERDEVWPAHDLTLVPHSRETLPSAALSPAAGGDVPVTTSDPSGRQSAEPFFLLQAQIVEPARGAGAVGIRSGRAGWIRVKLPWRPLSVQAWTSALQFFQRRYRI